MDSNNSEEARGATHEDDHQAKRDVLVPEHVRAYYEAVRGKFWVPAAGPNEFTCVDKMSLKAYFTWDCGITDKARNHNELTLRVQQERKLAYVGPLAGYKPGIVASKQEKILLVTDGYELVEPRQGDCSFILDMLEGRSTSDPAQALHIMVWLKLAYEALRAGHITPGLFLAIIGARNKHKTCFQELVITQILGGRPPAMPYQFFAGETTFNGDLIAAEHQLITDADVDCKALKARNSNSIISDRVKQVCGSTLQRVHFKGRDAFAADLFWRVSQSANDTWPHVLALPDLTDATVADKVMLTYFDGKDFGDWMPSKRDEIKARVDEQLPAFVHHLLEMEIPDNCYDKEKRFGQFAYKNPVALQKYFQLTREANLLAIIDAALFAHDEKLLKIRNITKDWEGRSGELEDILRVSKERSRKLGDIGARGAHFGRCLHSLAEQQPLTAKRIRVTTRNGRSYYHIRPPSTEEWV